MAMTTPATHRGNLPFSLSNRFHMPGSPYAESRGPNGIQQRPMWSDGREMHFYRHGASPTAMSGTPRFVTSPCSFIPILTPEANPSSMQGAVNVPRTSPFEFKKLSPTPSHYTATTVDSFENISSLEGPSSSPKGYQAVWIPPRDVSVRRVLEKSFDVAQHRRSPLGDLASWKNSWSSREEDPVRKSRIKTEMCMHYENGTQCPFGVNCTYAHGEEELQMTKLVDLHRSGLVDLDTYRTKPCLTWVSTGSCPFGKRCSGIHDPRAAGIQQSWLPHTETQGNTIATDINVESLHQKRLHAIHFDNPFGDLFRVDLDEWGDLYKLICNIPSAPPTRKRRSILAEHHKVDIALQLRGPADWHYKFRPQHIIYDELCMVLQKRAFRLTDSGAIEIPLSVVNSNRFANQVVVREIAFGPDCDPTVRGVSLWFDIADKDVTVCTPQQAKRYRWKKGVKNNRDNASSPFPSKPKTSAFESKDCFVMVRAAEKDAYDLSTDILAHYLGMLRSERIANLRSRSAALTALQIESERLKTNFDQLKRHWHTWAWPINQGRSRVDEHTPVPPVDGKYGPCPAWTGNGRGRPVVKRIWESFVALDGPGHGDAPHSAVQNRYRLPVLKKLAKGASTSSNARNPHILRSPMAVQDAGTPDSKRCWKALLLTPAYPFYEANEWKAVREHFENSRSKKVLSILQQ